MDIFQNGFLDKGKLLQIILHIYYLSLQYEPLKIYLYTNL